MAENFLNRLGDDGLNWWVGVVENNIDPLEAGRCKVRIFGAHTDNLDELPTDGLPWATVSYSPNSGRAFSAPMEGDWVIGFFLDGESKQAPIITGIFASIPQQDPTSETGKGFNAAAKYYKKPEAKSQAYIPVVYANTPAQKIIRVGEPTTPATAIQYNGTGIENSDNNRAHVCDITNQIRLSSAIEFIKNLEIFQAIRKSIESLTDASSASPITTQIVSAIKCLRAYVKMIQYALKVVNKFVEDILNVLRTIRLMITWILSLPARLLAMLQQCLTELYGSVSQAIGYTLDKASGTEIIQEIKGLYGDVISTVNTAVQTTAASQTAVNEASNLLNPKTYGKP